MKNSQEANAYYKRQSDYAKLAFTKGNLMPRRYVLVLTNLCNLKCVFCVQERKKKASFMNTEDWINLIDQIPKNSRITLTGGEPTVFDYKRKGFETIFAKANEFSETNMITNGLLLNNQRIELLVNEKNFKVLAVSVDTIGNVNRDFKKSQWDFLVEQLNKFIRLRDKQNDKTALDIKTVILEENIQDLFKIHKLVMETLKADTHSLQMLKGAEIQHSDLMFDFEAINKEYEAYQYKKFDLFVDQLNLIKEYDYKHGYKSYLHPSLLDFSDNKSFRKEDLLYLNNKKHDPKHFATCYSPWGCVYINVDGNLFPCMAIPLGNVKTSKLSDIIFSDESKKFRNIIRAKGTINGCNRCGYLKPKEV